MESLLLWTGRIAGIAGMALIAYVACRRVTGVFFAAGYQVGAFLLASTASMLVACLCFLVVLTDRSRR